MPQSKKDNQGGKTHAAKKTHSSGAVSEKAAAKKSGGRSGLFRRPTPTGQPRLIGRRPDGRLEGQPDSRPDGRWDIRSDQDQPIDQRDR